MPRLLRKLAALDARSFADLLIAQWALVRADRRKRTQPVGSLTTRERAPHAPTSGDPARARALALAVSRAADHGLFRPFCLVRAIALRELLLSLIHI